MQKSKTYIDSIQSLKSNMDKTLNNEVVNLIEVKDITIGEGVHVRYLDYYFNGAPKGLFDNLINKRRRNVLIVQNEILTLVLMEQCQSKN